MTAIRPMKPEIIPHQDPRPRYGIDGPNDRLLAARGSAISRHGQDVIYHGMIGTSGEGDLDRVTQDPYQAAMLTWLEGKATHTRRSYMTAMRSFLRPWAGTISR